MMFSFEGDFRRRPEQSLRGASKKEQTSELLRRNQFERQKRETHRRKIRSSELIQACYRSYRVRKTQKNVQRAYFDKKLKDGLSADDLFDLLHRLRFFHQAQEDSSRLLKLSQIFLKQKYDTGSAAIHNEKYAYRLKGLLTLTLQYLESISVSNDPLAIPLRILEVFTCEETFPGDSQTLVSELLLHLVQNGFFGQVRTVLEGRVPGDLSRTERAPTPLAESVFHLLMRPITASAILNDVSKRNTVLTRFARSILCPTFSNQIFNFLLPALVATKTIDASQLLDSLIPGDDLDSIHSSELSLTVRQTPWLLYSILSIVSSSSTLVLDHRHLVKYLLALQLLMKTLPQNQDAGNNSDSDSEAEKSPMEIEQDALTLESISENCLNTLESSEQIKCVLDAVIYDQRPLVVLAVCTICHQLIVQQRLSIHESKLLNALAFNGSFIRKVWNLCISIANKGVAGEKQPLLQLISRGIPMSPNDSQRIAPVLSIFAALFSTSILSLDDSEFFATEQMGRWRMPFSLQELVPISLALRDACLGVIDIFYPDSKPVLNEQYQSVFTGYGSTGRMTVEEWNEQTKTWQHLFKVTVFLVKQLYARDTRRQFCPEGHWLSNRVVIVAERLSQIYQHGQTVFVRKKVGELGVTNPAVEMDMDEPPPLSTSDSRNLTILTEVPFVVPFQERVKIFRRLLHKDREQNQSDMNDFGRGPSINILVRRNYIYEDAFEKLSKENEPSLKLKMRVQLKNAAGLDEAGIDGGGVFREFLSQVIKAAFDPNRGFFKTTTDETLYPNPHAKLIHPDCMDHYFFIGRLLGKALYENMLIELPLAGFFVSKILSRYSGDVDINHLSSLDPEMYRNLISLNRYEGDVSDLALDFTVVNDVLGTTEVDELVPNGREIPVTNENRAVYIHRVSDYRLNRQIRSQCNAFREGLADVLNLEWLRMFDQHELLVLITGAEIPIDVEDLKKHTNYSGGYNFDHPVIQQFWDIVDEFSEKQKRLLLKFVTSCSRPPLLGFKELYPAFCIHYGGNESDRLPTASTCMNLLKLPEFKDSRTLKDKLIYAIESDAGFELS